MLLSEQERAFRWVRRKEGNFEAGVPKRVCCDCCQTRSDVSQVGGQMLLGVVKACTCLTALFMQRKREGMG